MCTLAGWLYFYRLYRLNKFAYGIIRDRRAVLEKESRAGTVSTRNDLLSLYLDKTNFESDAYMEPTDSNMRDVILNTLIAGRDTTAQALSWTFFELCTHPEVQSKVRAEVQQALAATAAGGGGAGGAASAMDGDRFDYNMLQQCKYTEAVCNEALRLHPSVPKEAKVVVRDEVLPDGTQCRSGDVLSFSPWAMGRDKDLWGENALEFYPQRFIDNPKPSPFVFTVCVCVCVCADY